MSYSCDDSVDEQTVSQSMKRMEKDVHCTSPKHNVIDSKMQIAQTLKIQKEIEEWE